MQSFPSYRAYGSAAVDADPDGDGQPVQGFNIRFPGQYFDADTGLHYNRFRYYDPGTGRYISSDLIGQAGSVNVYSYADNQPVSSVDSFGLDTAVVVGGPTGGNPFGHVALATTGKGVTSFGTGTPAGSSLTDYLKKQSEYRDSTVYIIATTPEQEAEIQRVLDSYLGRPLPEVPSPESEDTCASRSNEALRAAGLLDPSNPLSTLASLLGLHSPLPESTAAIGALESRGNSVSVPRNSATIPSSLIRFNPK